MYPVWPLQSKYTLPLDDVVSDMKFVVSFFAKWIVLQVVLTRNKNNDLANYPLTLRINVQMYNKYKEYNEYIQL